jgi:hypothetical protein
VLALFENADGTEQEWVHGLQDDGGHAPVPVDQDEVRPLYRCDFCNEDDETSWILPVKAFPLPGQDQHMSGDDWSACPPCAAHLSTGRWAALFKRSTVIWERQHKQKMPLIVRGSLMALHQRVRENTTGPLYPFEPVPVVVKAEQGKPDSLWLWGQSRDRGKAR